MKMMQEFHLKQTHHEITFYGYDIERIEPITPSHLSRIFIPECARKNCGGIKECEKDVNITNCVNCSEPHFQELLIDGWYIGNKYGFLDENSYVAYLQTGIRVPVNREIYDAWINGFTDEPQYSKDKVYEIILEMEEKAWRRYEQSNRLLDGYEESLQLAKEQGATIEEIADLEQSIGEIKGELLEMAYLDGLDEPYMAFDY